MLEPDDSWRPGSNKRPDWRQAWGELDAKTRIFVLAGVVIAAGWIGISIREGLISAQTEQVSVTSPTAPPAAPRSTSLIDEYGGNQAVYDRIAGSMDCTTLQNQFDLAADNNDRADPGTAEHKWTLGYMKAADTRMAAIGCY